MPCRCERITPRAPRTGGTDPSRSNVRWTLRQRRRPATHPPTRRTQEEKGRARTPHVTQARAGGSPEGMQHPRRRGRGDRGRVIHPAGFPSLCVHAVLRASRVTHRQDCPRPRPGLNTCRTEGARAPGHRARSPKSTTSASQRPPREGRPTSKERRHRGIAGRGPEEEGRPKGCNTSNRRALAGGSPEGMQHPIRAGGQRAAMTTKHARADRTP